MSSHLLEKEYSLNHMKPSFPMHCKVATHGFELLENQGMDIGKIVIGNQEFSVILCSI